MKWLLSISLLLFLVGCNSFNEIENNSISFEDLVGQWRVDSSSNRFYDHSDVFINESGNFYYFSNQNGGGLLHEGVIMGDTLISNGSTKFTFKLLDSNSLVLKNNFSHEKLFLNKYNFGSVGENLAEALSSDSLRTKVIGWWKLKQKEHYFRIPRISGLTAVDFTLQVNSEGRAIIYKDNMLDSAESYPYSVYSDALNLFHGCTTTKLNVQSISTDSLVIISQNSNYEQLTFVRIKHI